MQPQLKNAKQILSHSSHKKETALWIQTELESADLRDSRLNKRLNTIIESFSALPNASIPDKSGSWTKTKATYRFLNNKKVTPENILRPHQHTTKVRISKEKILLAVQDTTYSNYTHLTQTEGLGNIGANQNLRGILLHSTLAFTPKRIPLGIIHQQSWIRPPEEYGKKNKRHKKSIHEKESQKWLNSLVATQEVQKDFPNTLFINIGDREADIYELFLHASQNNFSTHLIIRAACNRKVDHPEKHLWSYMETQPIAGSCEVCVPRKNKKEERIANVDVRFAKVTLKPPRAKPNLPLIQLWAIYINESSPPKNEEPLSWMLLTTLEVSSFEEAIQYAEYYSIRFLVELFHKILKSGCKIEKRQLQTAEGLMRCLALDSIVAWRIFFLTMLGRDLPELPCTVILEEHEWKALYCFTHKTPKPPDAPLSLGEATRLIAKLGGFLGRKHDGHPGVQVMWRGMQKLSIISIAWKAFGH